MEERELYSIEDARFLLGGISRMLIYELLNSGELSSVLIGRRRFVPATAISAFIATTATNAAPSRNRAIGRRRVVQTRLPLELPLKKPARTRSATRR